MKMQGVRTKKLIFFVLVILLVVVSSGIISVHAEPVVEWEKTFGGIQDELGYEVHQTSDGGYITAGYYFDEKGINTFQPEINANLFLLKLANATYNYFLTADSNNNGFLDGWYDPLPEIDGLIFSIGKYSNSWWEFDEYPPVDYDYDVDKDLPNVFPRVLNDAPGGQEVNIHFSLNDEQRSKAITLLLNTMNWGGAIDKVQLYVNNNFISQFSLGGSYTEKSFNFSSNYFLSGRNTIKIKMSCIYCNSWFVWDAIQLGETSKIADWHKYGVGEDFDDKASPEEVGFYMLSHIGAYETGLIDKGTAETRITNALLTLKAKPKSNGLFYRYYNTHKNEHTNYDIPSIGNAMLAASLITIKQWALEQGFTTISDESSLILQNINLSYFWDPATNLFYHDSTKSGHWDFYSDEGRLLSFVAFALNQISQDQLEQNLQALAQTTLYYDISAGGSVTDPTAPEDIKVDRVSWDGSMFTYLVPSLFIQEQKTNYLQNTSNPAVQAQIEYAKNMSYKLNSNYVWGISDCFDPSLQYCWEYQGAPPTKGFLGGNPYEVCSGLITPHASALALITDYSAEAIENLKVLSEHTGLYDNNYGFKDSVNVLTGNITNRFLTLDQEWIFLSLINKLNDTIWTYFYKDPNVVKAHNVIYKNLINFSINLHTGWNLISIPLILENGSVDNVLEGINYSKLFYYDSGWKNASRINNTPGYWIKVNDNSMLKVQGLQPEWAPISINKSWKLVGYPSLEEKNIFEVYNDTIVYAYNDSKWYSYSPKKNINTLDRLVPGYGYWIKKN